MTELLNITIIAVTVFLIGAFAQRFRLRQFWNRRCTGSLWRRRFPQTPKPEIRAFLDLLVSALAFSESKRLCFAPDDHIMAIYRALYPYPKVMADALELETFVSDVRERYGVDLLPLWRDDITLGELFSHATKIA
jgi:propanediol dehydratase small subunit